MKKVSLFIAVLSAFAVNSQITPDITVATPGTQESYFYHTKLGIAGYKYVIVDKNAKTITLFNLNNSVYKTINIPMTGTSTAYFVSHLSDNMFDTNADIEYAVVTQIGAGFTPSQLYIFKENGSTMFFRDSASLSVNSAELIHLSTAGIFKAPGGVKMKVFRFTSSPMFASSVEVYDLGGVLPCIECSSSGTVTGIGEAGGGNYAEPAFYPNPASQELRLRYKLPETADRATIEIHDLSGRLVDRMEVSSHFDHVKVPATYNSGMYFYSLFVGDHLIKTEKIVLEN